MCGMSLQINFVRNKLRDFETPLVKIHPVVALITVVRKKSVGCLLLELINRVRGHGGDALIKSSMKVCNVLVKDDSRNNHT